MYTAQPLVVAAQAVPFVRAMLVGPDALRTAADSHIEGLRRDATMASVAGAAQILSAGTGINRLAGSVYDLQTNTPSAEGAVSSFASYLETLPSGYYALGRGALQSALVEKRGALTLDARLPSRRKPAQAVGITDDIYQQRCITDSEHRMATFYYFVRPALLDPDIHDSLLTAYGITDNHLVRLEAIWNDPAIAPANRRTALDLWYHYFQESLDSGGTAAGIVAETHLFANAAARLFELALAASSDVHHDKLRSRAVSVLSAWLQVDENFSALTYLTMIRWFLDTDGHPDDRELPLIRLYSGILAAHGPTLTRPGHLHDAIVEGALALLDIARDTRLARATRTYAFAAALYAVEKFVPTGAQIMCDWTRWQVETEADPARAVQYADDYMQIFTSACWDDRIPVSAQQRDVGLLALRRRDLSEQHRKQLWDLMDVNQDIWTIGRNRWARRFGAAADPKPAQPAQAA